MDKYLDFKNSADVTYSCKYHVVWCSKYRRDVLVNGADTRLENILHEVAKERQAEIIELEIMPDHVHMLCEVIPQYSIHKLVKQFKGRSSRLLRQEFRWIRSRIPTLWTNAYLVSSLGEVSLLTIKQYIEQQKDV